MFNVYLDLWDSAGLPKLCLRHAAGPEWPAAGMTDLRPAQTCSYSRFSVEFYPVVSCVQVNVYILGKTFLLLARELCINAPAIGENFIL